MLLSDAILLKDYTVTGEADTPTCSYRKCPEQMETGPIVSICNRIFSGPSGVLID